jgi:hypothetical protein
MSKKANVALVPSNGQNKKHTPRPLVASSGQRWTTPQVAHFLQVTPRTIQAWRDEGKLKFIRINCRVIRYDEGEVKALRQ